MISCAQGILRAQFEMAGSTSSGPVRIFNSDYSVLELQESRTDLPCAVKPVKPVLGFDLRFHAGYEVAIPLKELSGNENLLTIVFRVARDDHRDEPIYFSQKVTVPPIEEDAKGEAVLGGNFDLGEGKYHVDWLMRDRTERVCSSYWEAEAALPPKDKQLALDITPGTVHSSDREPFREEPPVDRDSTSPLNVKVLVNFAPQHERSPMLRPIDTGALVSILRNIAREPRIARFSVVAFNLHEQRVLYRQDASDQIDFPSIGDAVKSLRLGTIDLKRLSQKHGGTEFLSSLVAKELNCAERTDAVIFAGPKAMLDENVPAEELKKLGELPFPVFYMNYSFNPQAVPWRDAIGNVVKVFKGAEYTISRPRDLWYAWKEIMNRISTGRHAAKPAVAAPTVASR